MCQVLKNYKNDILFDINENISIYTCIISHDLKSYKLMMIFNNHPFTHFINFLVNYRNLIAIEILSDVHRCHCV